VQPRCFLKIYYLTLTREAARPFGVDRVIGDWGWGQPSPPTPPRIGVSIERAYSSVEIETTRRQWDGWEPRRFIARDGGPATRSNRTQFIKRMVEFSQAIGLKIRLIYYPPYHSKYNPIERCWAALEQYWNGTILDSVEVALKWASNMTWKGIKPLVYQVKTIYEKGIKVLPKQLKQYLQYWQRSETLAQWDITITPT
jgi:Rhodopirellula transposase DDE domain